MKALKVSVELLLDRGCKQDCFENTKYKHINILCKDGRRFVFFCGIIEFEHYFEEMGEKELISRLNDVFEYIKDKKLDGKKNLCVTYFIEEDQFTFGFSPSLMKLLIENDCYFSLDNISFYDY